MNPTNGNETLGHSTLVDSLNAAYELILKALLDGSRMLGIIVPGVPDSNWVEGWVPTRVFNLAIKAGWLSLPPEPQEGQGVELGDFYVEEKYEDWFLGLLEPSISRFRETAAKNDADEEARRLQRGMFEVCFKYGVNERLHPGAALKVEVENVVPEWSVALKAAKVPETTSKERKDLEQRYLATHKHFHYEDEFLMKELCWMAAANQKQWERWRRGEIPNNSQPGRRILALLERNEQARSQKTLPPRSRE